MATRAYEMGRRAERRRVARHAKRILHVVECVEARCMAADGPVTPTLEEMTEKELRVLWRAARGLAEAAR